MPTLVQTWTGGSEGLHATVPGGPGEQQVPYSPESQLLPSLQSGGGLEKMSWNEQGDHGKQMEARQRLDEV